MKKIYTFLIALIAILNFNNKAYAQCTASVAYPTPATVNNTYATFTQQSFTPTCSGQLTSITFTFHKNRADDLRSTGWNIKCNLKTTSGTVLATGIWPNGSSLTEDVYPTKTLTANFDCTAPFLTNGTQYVWELEEVPPAATALLKLFLLEKSTTSVYSGGNLIQDGVASTSSDCMGWSLTMSSSNIATANSTKTQNVSCNAFTNATPELIAKVVPGTTSGISGSTTAKVWLETTQPAQFVKRHYEITPATGASTATGKVTLYFTQQEFDDFNAVNTLKLPTGTADATGKANLRIEKRAGTSSTGTGLPGTYSGAITTIDPADADIIWNSGASRWEVTFDVTGFSGFFVKTITGTLPLHWLSVNGNLNNSKQAVLTFKVNETNVANYSIEKSTDGRTFVSIANINSKGNGENTYSFTEATALQGLGYYRIKQVDADGRYSYSTIIKLVNQQISTLTVYPNPVKDIVTISGAKVGNNLMLTDISGKQLQQINITATSFTIDMSKYSSGIYLLKTEGTTQKIIKE
jgi:hypothetical protein